MGRNRIAWQANFGDGLSQFWKNAGWHSLHPVQIGIGGPTVMVNLLVLLAVVQVGSLFSSDAWNNITFTAGEVKNPKRNIPLSLVLGTGFVLTVYFFASLAYLVVLPLHGDPNGTTVLARGVQYAAEDRVGTAVLEQIFSSGGAYLMAAAILVSVFGCANGMSLAGARVYYAMSQDGLFFKSVGKLHPRYRTPVAGLLLQAAWATVLCISGSYGQLLDYIIFAVPAVLYSDDSGFVRAAFQAARRAPALQSARATRCCPHYILGSHPGSVSYYCDISLNTRGRASCLSCSASCLSFLVAPGRRPSARRPNSIRYQPLRRKSLNHVQAASR